VIPVSFGLNLKSTLSEVSVLSMLFHHDSGVHFKPETRFWSSL